MYDKQAALINSLVSMVFVTWAAEVFYQLENHYSSGPLLDTLTPCLYFPGHRWNEPRLPKTGDLILGWRKDR